MHVHAFIEEMERLAPPDLAEDFDAEKIGLVVEGRPEDIPGLLCAGCDTVRGKTGGCGIG